jgi:hypothetical protein
VKARDKRKGERRERTGKNEGRAKRNVAQTRSGHRIENVPLIEYQMFQSNIEKQVERKID